MTQPAKRKDRDHDILAKTLLNCPPFHDRKELSGYDLRDLTNALKYEQVARGERAFTYGDQAEYFYIVVKGLVSVNLPNYGKIEDWETQWTQYKKLQDWKQKFDKRIEEANRRAQEIKMEEERMRTSNASVSIRKSQGTI